jgi:hypothetical protein
VQKRHPWVVWISRSAPVLRLIPPAAAPAGDRPGVTAKGIDMRGDSADFPQPRGSITSPVRGSSRDVSRVKLSHSPLLFHTGRLKGQCLSTRNSGSRGFGGARGPPHLQQTTAAAKVEEVGGG